MKTNQLKTNTTRQPSILNPNKGFLIIVWRKVISKLQGLTYTEKKFLLHVIDNFAQNKTLTNNQQHWVSSTNIVTEITYMFLEQQKILLSNFVPNYSHNAFSEKYHHAKGTNGIRVQKFIRHYMHTILTEREMRSYSKHWIEKYPNKSYKHDDIKPFAKFCIKKMQVFCMRLANKIYEHGTQIVHIAEPKSYFQSRLVEIKQSYELLTADFAFYHNMDIYIPSNTNFYRDIVIAYDNYMDRYIQYSNLDFSSNIATKIISNSLITDIISAINTAVKYAPKKIVNDKNKRKETIIACKEMSGYAEAMRFMPASQQDDRHFTINSRGEMSYTPAKKPTYLSSSRQKWLAGQDRMVSKYGKGVKKLFQNYPNSIPDHIIEHVCNALKSQHQFTGVIKQVEKDEIVKYYHYDQMHSDIALGSLGNSCMKHSNCQPFIKFYAENNDVVKMIIILENDALVARALLWTTKCNTLIMDRIYGSDKYITIMKQYAQDKGYIIKARQSYEESTTWITPIGEKINKVYCVQAKYMKGQKMPYMDTFFNSVSISERKDYMNIELFNDYQRNSATLRSTSGGITRAMKDFNMNADGTHPQPETRDGQVCIDGEWYDEEDVGFCEHYQEHYHIDELNYCEADDCSYHTDISYWVDDSHSFCTERDYDCHRWSEAEDDYIWVDDAVTLYDRNGNPSDVCRENYQYKAYCIVNEYYMHEDDVFYCEILEGDVSMENERVITVVESNGEVTSRSIADILELDDDRVISYLEENDIVLADQQ